MRCRLKNQDGQLICTKTLRTHMLQSIAKGTIDHWRVTFV